MATKSASTRPPAFLSSAIAVLAFALVTEGARADVVTDWNVIAFDTFKAANVGGNPLSRALAIMHEIATVDPPPPSTINSKLSVAFDRVIQRALAKDRKNRYGSAVELAEELGALDVGRQSARSWTLSTLKLRWVALVLVAIVALVSGWNLRV